MTRLFSFFLWVAVLGLPAVVVHAAELQDLPSGGVATVTAVIDGDTVVLDDGRQVRLVGIQAPKLALGRAGFVAWPLAAEAKAHLQRLVLGQAVELRLGPQAMDRHGRVLAHVLRVSDNVWAQGEMLRAGLARVYTFPDNRLLASEMLALERLARGDKTGLWGLPYYALRNPDNVRHDLDTFQIVEGRVLYAQRIKNRVYLNFGADWRTDFTVKVATRHEKAFGKSGLDLLALKGMRVRVRGWIKAQNGAMIELDHPERLEVLNP